MVQESSPASTDSSRETVVLSPDGISASVSEPPIPVLVAASLRTPVAARPPTTKAVSNASTPTIPAKDLTGTLLRTACQTWYGWTPKVSPPPPPHCLRLADALGMEGKVGALIVVQIVLLAATIGAFAFMLSLWATLRVTFVGCRRAPLRRPKRRKAPTRSAPSAHSWR